MKIQPLFAAMMVASLVGCANDPVPDTQLELTQQAVDQAVAVGATDDQPDMALARSKLLQARAEMADKDYRQARMLAEQAELDARLAEARELTQKSQDQLDLLNTRIERLHRQLERAP